MGGIIPVGEGLLHFTKRLKDTYVTGLWLAFWIQCYMRGASVLKVALQVIPDIRTVIRSRQSFFYFILLTT